MAFTVLTSSPANGDQAVPLDTSIQLEFSQPPELFTVQNGISLYSIGAQTWTGSMMSQKDAATSDVKSSTDQITLVECSYSVSGSNVTIKPTSLLQKNTQYYIQIAPGTDTAKVLTAATYDTPIYSYATSGNNGVIEITSPYTGASNVVYELLFSSDSGFDLMVDGIYKDSYTFVQFQQFLLNKNINISINGTFGIGDIATINLYTPVGLSTLCKFSFVTSEYTSDVPQSTRIEDKLYKALLDELKVVSTIPPSLSVNNTRVNPIIIKFNKQLDQFQDIASSIKVFKINLETGSAKKINYYPQVNGDTVKIYMVTVDNISEVSHLPIFEVAADAYSITDDYTIVTEKIVM